VRRRFEPYWPLVLIPLTIVPGFLVSLIVQDFADRLLAEGTDPSTLRNTVMPLRVIAKWHEARGDIAVNPTRRVQLPSVRGHARSHRIAG
jgi:hypothetical protein